MAIYVGGQEISDIRIGTTKINSVWVGGAKVWQRATVTVSGATITDANEFYGLASVRFNSDGTVDEGAAGNYSQINAGTDWVRPVSEAPGSYQIRARRVSGAPASNVLGAALNTWLALTTSRTWTVGAGLNQLVSVTLRINIREGTGAILDTGDYVLSAQGLQP